MLRDSQIRGKSAGFVLATSAGLTDPRACPRDSMLATSAGLTDPRDFFLRASRGISRGSPRGFRGLSAGLPRDPQIRGMSAGFPRGPQIRGTSAGFPRGPQIRGMSAGWLYEARRAAIQVR